MNRPRAIRIYLPLLVAGLIALATLAMSGRHADAQTHPARHAAMGSMHTSDVTARQLAFRNAMRGLCNTSPGRGWRSSASPATCLT